MPPSLAGYAVLSIVMGWGGASRQLSDSAVTLRGLLAAITDSAAGGSGATHWVLALPQPQLLQGHRVGRLPISGVTRSWSRLDRFYVEARGTLSTDADGLPVLNVTGMKEVQPDGLARGEVSTSFSQRVALSLFVLPRTFRWRDAAGEPSGVGPVVVFSLNNHGQALLTLEFTSKDYACFQVQKQNASLVWEYARQVNQPTDQMKVTLPQFVREMLALPENAAPSPGKYRVRAGLCGYREYQLEAEFEVLG